MPEDYSVNEAVLDSRISIAPTPPSVGFSVFKRSVDIFTSLMLFPAFLVVCLIVSILNPFLNRGILLYTQQRVGKNNELFKVYKLRTMQGRSENAKFATDERARIGLFGQFLRHIHVDELPQIINVLIGEMSLIGPRPEQPEFFEDYSNTIQGFGVRQTIRPGISGLAQLRCGYTNDHVGARHKLKWDLEYIHNLGFRLECYIYFQTYMYVFARITKRVTGLVMGNINS